MSGSVSHLEALQQLRVVQAALFEVVQGLSMVGQTLRVEGGHPSQQLRAGQAAGEAVRIGGGRPLAGQLFESLQSLRKAQPLAELEEVQHVAFGLAAEAVEELLGRVHDQRSLGVLVPGAAGGQVFSNALELEPLVAHELGQVHPALELVQAMAVEVVHR